MPPPLPLSHTSGAPRRPREDVVARLLADRVSVLRDLEGQLVELLLERLHNC